MLGDARLGGRHHERAFGRVALHRPRAVFFHEVRVGRQRRGLQEFQEGRRRTHAFAVLLEQSLRFVSRSGDVVRSFARHDAAHGHFVLRERAGFVGANDGRRSERFHGGEFAHERVAFHHALHADGERDRDDRGQRFGHDRHGERDAEDDELHHVFAAREAERHDERDDADGRQREHVADPIEVFLQRGGAGFHGAEQAGDRAEFRLHARERHHGGAAPLRDRRAGEHHVLLIAHGEIFVFQDAGRFRYGHGFAREGRFVDVQLHRGDHARVRRHFVARLEQHDVAGHQFFRGNVSLFAVAQYRRDGCGEFLQQFDRAFGAVFLHEAKQRGEEDDHADADRFDFVAEGERQPGAEQEDDDEDVFELGEEQCQRGCPAGSDEDVASFFQQAQFGLGSG